MDELVAALDIAAEVAVVERALDVDFATQEGVRFIHRDRLFEVVAAAVARRDTGELAAALNRAGVCWEPYRTLREAMQEDARLVSGNDMFAPVAHPGGDRYPPRAMARFVNEEPAAPGRTPRLGEHSEAVLADLLDLSSGRSASCSTRGSSRDRPEPVVRSSGYHSFPAE